ncbi:hypothetical protein [Lysobacter enzymogenes]|uniref:hypothetical protein n=1 Tax=Lysobacter enzymogenes TaxID=69 RepID=UPI001A971CAF|nr:hypothetical protein [Lysobacter enzymogenes]QQP96056.1 hypothetical protein JHW38_23055 [Lysobacter enzymogenes]
MSYATTDSTVPAHFSPLPRARALLAFLAAALFAAMLSFSGAAAADPAVASQIMQIARQDRQLMDLHIQIARQQASMGNIVGAKNSYTSAQIQAIKLNMDFVRLVAEHRDSLDRGLYRNRAALERAINYAQLANADAQMLSLDLQQLVQLPTSPQLQTRLQIDLITFSTHLTQLEQAMSEA